MKKSLLSFIIPLAVLALVVVVVPWGVKAQLSDSVNTYLKIISSEDQSQGQMDLVVYDTLGNAIPLDSFNFPKLSIGQYTTKLTFKEPHEDRTTILTTKLEVSSGKYRIYDIRDGVTGNTETGEIFISIEGRYVKILSHDGGSNDSPDTFLVEFTNAGGVNIPPLPSDGIGPYLNSNPGTYTMKAFQKRDSGELVEDSSAKIIVHDDHKGFTLYGLNSPVVNPTICPIFDRDLKLYDEGNDVSALQKLLIDNGFDIYPISSGNTPYGYFGPATAVALGKYQASIGIDEKLNRIPYFGLKTREYVDNICSHPFTVIYPKGGENFVTGDKMLIKWDPASPVSLIEIVSVNGNYSFGIYGQKYGDILPITTGTFSYVVSSTTPAGKYYIQLTHVGDREKVRSKVFSINQINQPSITDAEILQRLQSVVRNNLGTFPSGSPQLDFDLNGNGAVSISDELLMRNFATLSDAEFISVKKKLLIAIEKRVNAKSGSAYYDSKLDLNGDRVISLVEADRIRLAINSVNSIKVSLTINPDVIMVGETSTLTWKSTNATSCTSTGFRTNDKLSGSQVVKFTVPTTATYSITCKGEGGTTVSTSTTLRVNPSQPTNSDGTDISTRQISLAINPSSPISRTVVISNVAPTENVVLAKFDIKSQGQDATLRNLILSLHTSKIIASSIFSKVKININGVTYTADKISNSSATFSDLAVSLPADQNVTLTVLGDVFKDTNNIISGSNAGVVLDSDKIVVENKIRIAIPVKDSSISSNVTKFQVSSPIISNESAQLGTPIESNDVTVAQMVSFNFSLTAADKTLYISSNPSVALLTSGTGFNPLPAITAVSVTPASVTGDSSAYFVIPAGTTRAFKWSGAIKASDASTPGIVLRTFRVDSIRYGINTSNITEYSINASSALKVETVIGYPYTPPPTPVPTPVPTPSVPVPTPTATQPTPVVNLISSFSQGVYYPYDTLNTSGASISSAIESTGNVGGVASNRLSLSTSKQYKITYTLTQNSGTTPNIRFVSTADGRSYIHLAANGSRALDHTAVRGTNSVTFTPPTGSGYIEISVGSGSKTDFSITDVSLVEVGPSAQTNQFMANVYEVMRTIFSR